ncbi:magnesium transporter CorA family protein [Flavobacterium sp. DG1-102-2]|uniref:magnesium transporter CorA family protein n=1 Tax=Flavobacterium sp. DG1-102-2 TaxID=3081663 RepID=UPI002949EB32|nr:magnesium transporter CorA family protein [Flavobacterium sp. DG1-102-2]MDV6167809.1 magnesium transporter CorA family protein [Flavobacterium sp. DG1-102-2]
MITYYKNNATGIAAAATHADSIWISAVNPTLSEKTYLLEELKLPEAFYNDIEDIDERPRIEFEDGWCLIVVRIPFKNDDLKLPYTTAPLGIIFNDEVCISLCFVENELIEDFVTYSQRKNINVGDNFSLVFRLLLSSSIWFQKYLKQINQGIKLAENNLERSVRNEDLQALFRMEKCLEYFITSLKGNELLFYRIKNLKNHKESFDPEMVEDVEIEMKQAQDTTNIYSNILTGMMDAYASVISNNLNVVMKRLTSISIILMIPTLVASLYGMNVPNSLQDNPYGFAIILCVSLLFSFIGVILFRKKNLF